MEIISWANENMPRPEWLLVYLIFTLAILIIYVRTRSMFQEIQEQISRLASVVENLSLHINAIAQERDDLRAQVDQLRSQVADPVQLSSVVESLRTQVDKAASLFPSS